MAFGQISSENGSSKHLLWGTVWISPLSTAGKWIKPRHKRTWFILCESAGEGGQNTLAVSVTKSPQWIQIIPYNTQRNEIWQISAHRGEKLKKVSPEPRLKSFICQTPLFFVWASSSKWISWSPVSYNLARGLYNHFYNPNQGNVLMRHSRPWLSPQTCLCTLHERTEMMGMSHDRWWNDSAIHILAFHELHHFWL